MLFAFRFSLFSHLPPAGSHRVAFYSDRYDKIRASANTPTRRQTKRSPLFRFGLGFTSRTHFDRPTLYSARIMRPLLNANPLSPMISALGPSSESASANLARNPLFKKLIYLPTTCWVIVLNNDSAIHPKSAPVSQTTTTRGHFAFAQGRRLRSG